MTQPPIWAQALEAMNIASREETGQNPCNSKLIY